MFSPSSVPPDAPEPLRPNGGVLGSTPDWTLENWRRIVDWLTGNLVGRRAGQMDLQALYLRAQAEARVGSLVASERRFAELLAAAPGFAPGLEAHGEALDMLGASEQAAAQYDLARKLRSPVRRGAPDRCFAVRNRRVLIDDIVAYTAMI